MPREATSEARASETLSDEAAHGVAQPAAGYLWRRWLLLARKTQMARPVIGCLARLLPQMDVGTQKSRTRGWCIGPGFATLRAE